MQTSDLTEVSIDPVAHRVRVGSGIKWEKVAPQLSDHGLAGAARLVARRRHRRLLAGRRHRLARPQVRAADEQRHRDRAGDRRRRVPPRDAENEPDLFWALRGGGGNFGVVTAIEFAVYPVEELYAGALFFPFERAAEVLHTWRELLPTFPEELMTWANILHFPPLPGGPGAVPRRARSRSSWAPTWARSGGARAAAAACATSGPEIDTFAMVPPIELGELAMDPPDPLPFVSGHEMLERAAGAS